MAEPAFSDDLPLRLVPADVIPPEPNRSPTGSTFDWIPDLGGYAWVAYGASSLLVVSHLPSPMSEHESAVGPIFRQVFQLPSRVAAVSCCSRDGRVAAASGNCIFVYSPESARPFGSFCWGQNAVLSQSTEVDAVVWTSSGDGLISGGVEVALWKNDKSSWEIAWKYKVRLPQTLVSATWSLEGPSATAAHPVELWYEDASTHDESKSVTVCKSFKEFGYVKTELCHPHPVFMIQWRPLTERQFKKNSKIRDVLLTCCMDGAVRLWTEMDLGRVKKIEKESVNLKPRSFKFCVVAIIEKSSYPSATLNQRSLVRWATDVGRSCQFGEEDCRLFPVEFSETDKNWECEWLVGFGPDSEVTFWAIHCLDEFSPLRCPRLVKWKSKELHDVGNIVKHTLDQPSVGGKVVISRKNSSEPPSSCSFIHFLSCNSIVWSLLYDRELSSGRDMSVSLSPETSFLSSDAAGFLSVDGHNGKILQVVSHPYACDMGLAVSLDSNGSLLFWLLSTLSNYMPCRPTLNPAWKLFGKLVIPEGSSKPTSLAWVPFEMDEDQMVLLGHLCGIDCFMVNISSRDDCNFRWHKLCTIPFFERGPFEEGPTEIFSVPLSSSSSKSSKFCKFTLLAAWMKVFHILGWEISIQSHDLSGSYLEPNIDIDFTSQSNMLKFEDTFGGKRYQLFVSPSLSTFPEPHCHDQVTSFCVVRPSMSFSVSENEKTSEEESQDKQPAYIVATGCSNGDLKLWKSRKASNGLYLWELVGMAAHPSPISKLSVTDLGHFIAVLHGESNLGSGYSLRVWSAVNLIAGGCLLSEDMIDLDGDVVAMNWSALGNGHQILGVCLSDKLLVYTCKRYGGHYLLRSGEPASACPWVCIAYTHISSPVSSFFWGPCLTAIIVHGEFICLFSQWLSPVKSGTAGKDIPPHCQKGPVKHILPQFFNDIEMGNLQDSSLTNNENLCTYPPAKVLKIDDHSASGIFPENVYGEFDLHMRVTSRSIFEVTESLCGSLPMYHPETLMFNIYSGRWRRARLALQHIVAYISSCLKADTSQKCSNIIPQVILSSYLEGDEIPISKILDWSSYADTSAHSFSSQPDQVGLSSIISSLHSSHWGNTFSEKEKIEILAIIDLLGEIGDSHTTSVYGSLDDPGRRFWIAVRYRQLHFQQKFSKVASVEELSVDSASICWAFQSECQENLLDTFLPKESTWQELRAIGFGLWFNDLTKFRPKMEKMARLQYLKRKDPKDCALLYIALNRVQVLAGLFKLSKDEKDKPLVGFLSRNFQEERNRAAALKNAYVLLGRHQLELAISFFLLGGDTSSAITVCAKNLGDEQLALVICRLVEGGGGPLEHNLITKFMLPTAIEKGDYWLASLLEWQLGNHTKSLLTLLSSNNNSTKAELALSENQTPFLDPSIGLYCLFMAAKNNMKNAVGEYSAATFGRWATLITATALKKMGLPLEALEYLSSNVWREFDNEMVLDSRNSDITTSILVASGYSSSDWLSGGTALQLESHVKYDLACQHFVKLMREHPSWPCSNARSGKYKLNCKYDTAKDEKPPTMFLDKLRSDLMLVEQKLSLDAAFLTRMIAMFLYNGGSLFIAYDVLRCLKWQQDSHNQTNAIDKLALSLEKQTYKAAVEVSLLFSRFITSCGVICFQLTSHGSENRELHVLPSSSWSLYGGNQLVDVMHSLEKLRAALRIYYKLCDEDLRNRCFILMDLLEYLVHFSFVWRLKNSKALLLILHPLLASLSNGHTPYNVDMTDLKTVIYLIGEVMLCSSTNDDIGFIPHKSGSGEDHGRNKGVHMIPDDERTGILALSLWQHLSRFVDHKLQIILELPNGNNIPGSEPGQLPLFPFRSSQSNADSTDISNQMGLLVSCLSYSVKTSLLHVSSYHVKQLASLIREKMDNGFRAMTFVWLEESKQAETRALLERSSVDSMLEVLKNNHEASIYEILWNSWADRFIISESLMLEKIDWSKCANMKQLTRWRELQQGSTTEDDLSKDYQGGNRIGSPMTSSPSRTFFSTGNSLLNTWHKEATVVKEIVRFNNPKDILKRNGELLEALCINSTDERKIAVSSNRKGIIFCNMGVGFPCYQRNNKMWETEWPQHNWADSDATGVSTSISPSIGNGSKRGAHRQIGRATAVVSPMLAYGSDITGGGALGTPGSAETGTSILGRQVPEVEEFVEQSATVDNVRSRALSSHPSMPYFLVGSSNTHIYLWEFNKQKAVVTFGVLPTSDVPPPYALASISALQFDPCGQRFATAALDGTIRMWQLEVGGRNSSYPTESSLCFNGHASDITYVTSSGSVVAACGYSSNDMNVVMWDMLAPPSSSHASISCHEGGAHSIAVLDNYSGGGSVSPVILTGGKGGDVGLHDFRYVATGKTRRHRVSDNGEPSNREISTANESTMMGTKSGVENVGGMLWYLPKAHLGSVTKISPIPETSLFLTGSKEGDVKLWDAKTAKLLNHWPKLHEKHTFLQPGTRGFGGVVRAGVTDIKVIPHGFVSCGGDGSIKLVQLRDYI